MYIHIRKNLGRKDKIFNVVISDTFLNSAHIYFLIFFIKHGLIEEVNHYCNILR